MLQANIGHNLPPSDIELLIERLTVETADLRKRARELLSGAERCVITDADSAGKASLLAGLIMTAKDTTETRQKAAKKPHFDLANAAYDHFKPILEMLAQAKAKTLAALKTFDDEQERIAAAERQRLAEEARVASEAAFKLATEAETESDIDQAIALEEKADLAIATAQTVAAPEIRSTFGQLATARFDWKHRVTDLNLIPRHLLMLNEAAVKAHIKARVKDQPPAAIPGLEFFQEKTMTVKR